MNSAKLKKPNPKKTKKLRYGCMMCNLGMIEKILVYGAWWQWTNVRT